MADEFSDHAELHDYAESRGLEYVWEGTTAFGKYKAELSPEQFQILAVHTVNGVKMVLLYPKRLRKKSR